MTNQQIKFVQFRNKKCSEHRFSYFYFQNCMTLRQLVTSRLIMLVRQSIERKRHLPISCSLLRNFIGLQIGHFTVIRVDYFCLNTFQRCLAKGFARQLDILSRERICATTGYSSDNFCFQAESLIYFNLMQRIRLIDKYLLSAVGAALLFLLFQKNVLHKL